MAFFHYFLPEACYERPEKRGLEHELEGILHIHAEVFLPSIHIF